MLAGIRDTFWLNSYLQISWVQLYMYEHFQQFKAAI